MAAPDFTLDKIKRPFVSVTTPLVVDVYKRQIVTCQCIEDKQEVPPFIPHNINIPARRIQFADSIRIRPLIYRNIIISKRIIADKLNTIAVSYTHLPGAYGRSPSFSA